jgi:predicted HicB family RNase H-like nuclease
MDLSEYAESLRRELVGITRFAGEDVTRAAEMLAESLDSSVRLALLDVLSAAAQEITARLEGAVVDVRITGTQPEFVVTVHEDADFEDAAEAGDGSADDASQTRLTLRMSESLKGRVEAAASASGQSVNAWLVRAVTRGLEPSSGRGPKSPRLSVGRRYTGFARS